MLSDGSLDLIDSRHHFFTLEVDGHNDDSDQSKKSHNSNSAVVSFGLEFGFSFYLTTPGAIDLL